MYVNLVLCFAVGMDNVDQATSALEKLRQRRIRHHHDDVAEEDVRHLFSLLAGAFGTD